MTEIQGIKPPRRLKREEKELLLRIETARNDAQRPISAAESDLLFDYIFLRSRIGELRRRLRKSNPNAIFGDFHSIQREIDACEAASLRRAKTLMLIGI